MRAEAFDPAEAEGRQSPALHIPFPVAAAACANPAPGFPDTLEGYARQRGRLWRALLLAYQAPYNMHRSLALQAVGLRLSWLVLWMHGHHG